MSNTHSQKEHTCSDTISHTNTLSSHLVTWAINLHICSDQPLHHFFPLSNQTMFSPCTEALLPQMLTSIVHGLHSVWCLWAQPIRRLIPLKYLQANYEARARGLLIWFNKACLIWAYRKDWKTEGKSCYIQQKPIFESSEVSKVNFICVSCQYLDLVNICCCCSLIDHSEPSSFIDLR